MQSPLPHQHTKRHQSSEDDETRARKRERIESKAVRRASLIDEEARQIRAQALVAWMSSSIIAYVKRSTDEGVVIAIKNNDSVPTIEGAGSGKLNPPI